MNSTLVGVRTVLVGVALFVAACGGDAPGKGSGSGDGGADSGDGDGGSSGADSGSTGADSGSSGSGNATTSGSEGGVPSGCGDGEADPEESTEECDDGNVAGGDGCSEQCEIEDGWLCPPEGGECVANCGDGNLLGVEQCDDGNVEDGDGCSRSCEMEAGYACPTAGAACVAAACGDGIVAGDEECEDGGNVPGDGCDLRCRQEAGWLCVGAVCSAAECGDGIRAGMEACDDGNQVSGDGCLADCSGREPFHACPATGGACTRTTTCGDGIVTPDEFCDDGNAIDGDGCTDCVVDTGFTCPGGTTCATRCGDGVVAGVEQCEDVNECFGGGANDGAACDDDGDCDSGMCGQVSGDGCTETCRLEPGFKCEVPGMPCEPAVCGNGEREGLEECDDGDPVLGADNNLGDGCTPFCKLEPDCSGGACLARCGDGILAVDEECDDGNEDDNDGCSSECEFEPGYRCEVVTETPDDRVRIPVIYRDFKARNFDVDDDCGSDRHCCEPSEAGCTGGHPDFQGRPSGGGGMVNETLDDDGKPTRTGSGGGSIESDDSFADWYRDSARNLTVATEMELESCPGGTCNAGSGLCEGGSLDGEDCGTYVFSDSSFFPLTGLGFNHPSVPAGAFDETYGECDSGPQQNFHFTSEVRYWFQYEGDEVLNFTGDDDVWVYINGQLAVDIGGIHGAQDGCISLRPDQSGCDGGIPAARRNRVSPDDLDLEVGRIYEVVVFQAERNTCASNYRLTLAGFFTSKTECEPFCGDGVVTPDEVCDAGSLCSMGSEDGADCGLDAEAALMCVSGGGICESQNEMMTVPYGGCSQCAMRGRYCGDATHDPEEDCDDGALDNDGRYEGCNPDCTLGPVCGDGEIDGFFGEQCDDGAGVNADDTYGVCQTDCTLGPRCGDGVRQRDEGEDCDNGVNADAYEGCAPGCKRAPYCGDGIRQAAFGEQCDAGEGGNDGAYGGCTASCERAPFCGDGKIDRGEGEQCDDGNGNSFDGCSKDCKMENILI